MYYLSSYICVLPCLTLSELGLIVGCIIEVDISDLRHALPLVSWAELSDVLLK